MAGSVNQPALALATEGYLDCPTSKATVGHLICLVSLGGGDSSKRGGFNPGSRHGLRVLQEDSDVLAIIISSVNLLR